MRVDKVGAGLDVVIPTEAGIETDIEMEGKYE